MEKDLIISKNFMFTTSGLQIAEHTKYEEWLGCFQFLKAAEKSIQFWIGDWINFGERKWGDKYTEAFDMFDYDYGTLRNYAYVAKNVDLSRRNDKLSFSHFAEVASLEPKEQQRLLKKAEDEDFSVSKLRQFKLDGGDCEHRFITLCTKCHVKK